MADTIKLLNLQHRHSPFPFLGDLLKQQVLRRSIRDSEASLHKHHSW